MDTDDEQKFRKTQTLFKYKEISVVLAETEANPVLKLKLNAHWVKTRKRNIAGKNKYVETQQGTGIRYLFEQEVSPNRKSSALFALYIEAAEAIGDFQSSSGYGLCFEDYGFSGETGFGLFKHGDKFHYKKSKRFSEKPLTNWRLKRLKKMLFVKTTCKQPNRVDFNSLAESFEKQAKASRQRLAIKQVAEFEQLNTDQAMQIIEDTNNTGLELDVYKSVEERIEQLKSEAQARGILV